MTAILSTAALTKSYGALTVVSDVSISVEPGERRGIIGPNGAGKTTLFNLITGDIAPTSGTVSFDQQAITRRPTTWRARRGIRRTYQASALFDTLTVAENLMVAGLGPQGRQWNLVRQASKGRELMNRVEAAAGLGGLQERLGTLTADLSHGERRQLEIAMAFVHEPKVLLLDEPASGLSANERAQLSRTLNDVSRDVTVLLIEHDMEIALGFADNVTVLHGGKELMTGDPAAVVSSPEVQRVYLGGGDA
jgi:branched-chain amino acid transport system ATP-binding protein